MPLETKPTLNPAADLLNPRLSLEAVLNSLKTSRRGLARSEIPARLRLHGENQLVKSRRFSAVRQFLAKFINPLVIMLFVVAALSLFLGSQTDAGIILAMALISIFLSFFQEYHATRNEERLRGLVKITVNVRRDGKEAAVPLANIVPGDIVILQPGKMVPADLRLVTGNQLHVNQASLNGEAFPAPKYAAQSYESVLTIYDQPNFCFSGSSVASGYGEVSSSEPDRKPNWVGWPRIWPPDG